MIVRTLIGATALVALSLPAAAQSATATVTTDLNVRMGPGPQYEVVDVIPADQRVAVAGCTQSLAWCQVDLGGKVGWVYSDYLAYDAQGTVMTMRQAAPQVQTPIVEYEPDGTGAVSGMVGGATVGALVGGPVGAAVGGVAGAALGAIAAPSQQVTTYVTTQPADPVYLEGEVVIGAGLPENVPLYEVPEYQYRYAYVNGQRVLVDDSRRIVYVVR
jgi:uncharacterized protein YraI